MICTASKHFGGGIAISATITTDEIGEKAVETGPVDVANRIGRYRQSHLLRLKERHELVGDVRGRGLLQGIEFVTDRKTREPAYEQGQRIGRMLLDNGLIVSIRRHGSVLRFVPPFTTTQNQMDLAAEILDAAIGAVG